MTTRDLVDVNFSACRNVLISNSSLFATLLISFPNVCSLAVSMLETHNPSRRIMRLSYYTSGEKRGRAIEDAKSFWDELGQTFFSASIKFV